MRWLPNGETAKQFMLEHQAVDLRILARRDLYGHVPSMVSLLNSVHLWHWASNTEPHLDLAFRRHEDCAAAEEVLLGKVYFLLSYDLKRCYDGWVVFLFLNCDGGFQVRCNAT